MTSEEDALLRRVEAVGTEPSVTADAGVPSSPEGAAGRVLVVDDSPMNRMTLTSALERRGHSVASAEDGFEAIARLRESAFDCVLLDLVSPRINGFETLEAIKADPQLRHVPVIVMTSEDGAESVGRAIEMGALDHLPHPYDASIIHARLSAALAAKRLHELETEHLEDLGRMTAAVEALEAGAYHPTMLESVAERTDGLGTLARAIQRMASAVRAREEASRPDDGAARDDRDDPAETRPEPA